MKPDRGLSLILGILLGIAGGLYYAWVVSPAKFVDAAPASLRQDYKNDYLSLIAAAYAGTGDLGRAEARLAQLPDPNHAAALAALAQQRLAEGKSESEVRALALLAADLGERPSRPALTPSPQPPPPSPTPIVNLSPSPTAELPTATSPTPTATPSAKPTSPPPGTYYLLSQEKICDPELPQPLITVLVFDHADNQVPGVMIIVAWDTGQDTFHTGLKTEVGDGYADFSVMDDLTYTLQLAAGSEIVTGLSPHECLNEEGIAYPGSWMLTFKAASQR